MTVRILTLALLGLLIAACDGSGSVAINPPDPEEPLGVEVSLDSGRVLGREHPESSVWEWLAIPYAAAPVGERRWKAPQPAEPWSGVREVLEFGNECPQLSFSTDEVIGDEDCLHLNVWRPRSEERGLPVYVWIHGGSNTSGSNSWEVYQGDRLAERSNLVVISIQYRLGALGWLYFEPLHSGDALDDSGNYGSLDIIQSLSWIQDNIEAFGGDPENVIVTGESAGAINIMSLLTSTAASGLFHKAIIQSGAPLSADLTEARAAADTLVDRLAALQQPPVSDPDDATAAEILRAASAEDIVSAGGSLEVPLADGRVFPSEGVAASLSNGSYPNRVPIIVGTNRDEYKLWTNPLIYDAFPGIDPEVRDGVGRYASDLWRVVGADGFASDLVAQADQPAVFVYRFNWGSPNADGMSPLPGNFGQTLGAHHALEIPFVLGNWEEWLDPQGTPLFFTEANALGRENLSHAIMDYFAAFAWSDDPNTANRPSWQAFSLDGDFKAIEFDTRLADGEPLITVDDEIWTVDSVIADLNENLVEPVRSSVLAILLSLGWTE